MKRETKMHKELGNRVLVIGSAGSGKTTLSKWLSKILSLPIIHMDRHYWADNWCEPEDEVWEEKVREFCATDEWIMDGNYTKTMSLRLRFSTTVIFLDMPRWKCLLRVIVRRFRLFHNKKRDDIPANCNERMNLAFYRWIWNYPKRSRTEVLSLIEKFEGNVHHLKSSQDVKKFMRLIKN